MGLSMQDEKPVRVQKVIADHGLASRREAERWIEEGRVTVNDATAGLGDRCFPGRDKIAVDGRVLSRREPPKLVIAMHKPPGFACTNDDPHAQRTVFDLLPPELRKLRLFCVGRLDKDSEGLLLLTNDGSLQQQLAHPSYNVHKTYHVEIDKPLREADARKLVRGIEWEGERLAVNRVHPRKTRYGDNWKNLEIVMQHGKKREIRRLLYAFGYNVERLQRVQIGQLRLRGLPKGHIRTLGSKDIRLLFEPEPSR
jgi:23S rRNA pseudouridine2605 synthase